MCLFFLQETLFANVIFDEFVFERSGVIKNKLTTTPCSVFGVIDNLKMASDWLSLVELEFFEFKIMLKTS